MHPSLIVILVSFAIIALAAQQVGAGFRRIRLPLITGFLFAGMLAGPHLLELVSETDIRRLRFIDEISLGFIALAAGAEFHLRSMRPRMRNILSTAAGLVLVTFLVGSAGFFFLTPFVPVLADLSPAGRLAVAALAGAILIARSPSSAIAIVGELRAKGPFTRTVLGVTILMDVVVIVWFSGASAFADAILTNMGINLGFAALLLAELVASLAVGLTVAMAVIGILSLPVGRELRAVFVLLAGYAVFVLSDTVRAWSHEAFPFEFMLEPLFVCMVAGFYITNRSRHRDEFKQFVERAGPPIYVIFFSLAGASLGLDQLVRIWPIALALVGVRIVGIVIGSGAGGLLAGAPARHIRVSWMAYLTQAGVGLGLAKEVTREFPEWGGAFATLMIATIVVNQVLGPPLLKWVLHHVGEARERGEAGGRGSRRAFIFGLESQALALARQLGAHGWSATVVAERIGERQQTEVAATETDIVTVDDLSAETLREIGADKAGAIVSLLSDDDSYELCSTAHDRFGIENLVVRLHERKNLERFDELGVYIVDPDTAMPSLMDQLVRSPSAASLLLGTGDDRDLEDLVVGNREIEGLVVRDLDLPLDALIVSIHRDGRPLASHGFTRLRRGDCLTCLGSPESLKRIRLHVEA